MGLLRWDRLRLADVAGGAVASCVLLAACQKRATVHEIVAPDGAPALHIQCAEQPGRCYQLAGERCPQGYAIRPARSPSAVLVRCRRAAAPVHRYSYAASSPPVSPPAAAVIPRYPYPPPPASSPPASPPVVQAAPAATAPLEQADGGPPPSPGAHRAAPRRSGTLDPLLKDPWPGEDLGY